MVALLGVPSFAEEFNLDYWLKLLHYKNGQSLVDGKHFFLSPNGKKDPISELHATITAFSDKSARVGWFSYHPQCVFRERFTYLKKVGMLNGLEEEICTPFLEWKSGLNAESVSLIFSSSYPNNPSSIFGHTLLRFNQKNKVNDLLDYAVAFSAIPESDDLGIVFAYKGLFGGYKGLFELTKYYTKVNEYSHGESRDLIEYDLNLSEEELSRLVNHLWELYQTTYFDYYFADENCSSVLMDLFSVALKDDKSINEHKRFYYLPSEMVKAIFYKKGLVVNSRYRMSLKKKLKFSYEQLTTREQMRVKELVDMDSWDQLSVVDRKNYFTAEILDVVINYFEFSDYRKKLQLSDIEKIKFREALVLRASIQQNNDNHQGEKQNKNFIYSKEKSEENRPENGHSPEKISVWAKYFNKNIYPVIELKAGHHDLLSPDLGFDSFSQFDFLYGRILWDNETKKPRIDQLALVDLASLHPYVFYDPQLAWKAKISYKQIFEQNCLFCYKRSGEALGGMTLKNEITNSMEFILNIMGGAFIDESQHFKKGLRMGALGEISFYSGVNDILKFGILNRVYLNTWKSNKLNQNYNFELGGYFSLFVDKESDLRVEYKGISHIGNFKNKSHQVLLGLGHYF